MVFIKCFSGVGALDVHYFVLHYVEDGKSGDGEEIYTSKAFTERGARDVVVRHLLRRIDFAIWYDDNGNELTRDFVLG